MFCGKCGNKIDIYDAFCRFCGSSLNYSNNYSVSNISSDNKQLQHQQPYLQQEPKAPSQNQQRVIENKAKKKKDSGKKFLSKVVDIADFVDTWIPL